MRNLMQLLLIASLALPAGAGAQSPPPQAIAQRHAVVLDCVREIRQHTAGGEFQAYITLRGDIRTFGGSDADDAQFGQCLNRRGLAAPPRPGRSDLSGDAITRSSPGPARRNLARG